MGDENEPPWLLDRRDYTETSQSSPVRCWRQIVRIANVSTLEFTHVVANDIWAANSYSVHTSDLGTDLQRTGHIDIWGL